MTRPRIRRMRPVGGTPVEEAPIWALAILAVVFCLVLFPALVGLLNGLRLVSGGGWTVAAAAGVVSVLLVVGLARQRPWKRTTSADESFVETPFFVRFSTWIWVTLIIPNMLYGVLVLTRGGEGLDYLESWLIGGLVSVIHGGFALAERWRRRER